VKAIINMKVFIDTYGCAKNEYDSSVLAAALVDKGCSIVYDTREADVVVVAAGRPNTLSGDMLKAGAVVIDVGVNRIPDETKPKGFRLVGDADFESCAAVASAITPVPGGVGPMTITMLLWNTLESARG
jgi:methylenetetrahydrofolate dehydrogenase (NADP+)/methenyltetrahydrofolate cyclohydrolase